MAGTSPAEQLSPDAEFALHFADAIDRTAPPQQQIEEEAAVAAFAAELAGVDERLLVLNALSREAHDRSSIARAIEVAEDEKYGFGFLEVPLTDMPKAVERSLQGKNPAVIIRAGEWAALGGENTGDVIASSVADIGNFTKASEEKFPKRSMPTGSSGLHLDNFHTATPPGFRYAFSAAQVNRGNVLFIGGFAHGKALNTSPKREGVSHSYDEAMLRLEQSPGVQRVYEAARSGRSKSMTEVKPVIDGTELTAVVLHEGDVVIWPQGGPGSQTPDWHAFRKIGDQGRESTSYHFVEVVPPAPQAELGLSQ